MLTESYQHEFNFPRIFSNPPEDTHDQQSHAQYWGPGFQKILRLCKNQNHKLKNFMLSIITDPFLVYNIIFPFFPEASLERQEMKENSRP